MSDRRDEHTRTVPEKGMVSEGGVDTKTGSVTGAIAGAFLGASAGPLGLVAGALVGGAIGSIAASGVEKPDYPEPWPERRAELHEHDHDGEWDEHQ